MSNDEIMAILLNNENLSELEYKDNTLYYQGKSVDMRNVKLIDFFQNSYSQMYVDQHNISSEDFFNIMDLHSKTIEENYVKPKSSISDLNNIALNYLSDLEGSDY